jgi:hypothetical protein
LRPLDKTKILDPKNPQFKFKANTSFERVIDTLDKSRTRGYSDLAQSRNPSMIKLKNRINKTIDTALLTPKEIYPELH